MRLNQLQAVLDGLSYPLSAEALSAALEGQTIDHPEGQELAATVVERCGSSRLESADDAWLSLVGHLDEDAIGRKFYSDRDPPCGPREFDPVSF